MPRPSQTVRTGAGQYETPDGNYRIRRHGTGGSTQWIVIAWVGGDRPWITIGRAATKAEAIALIPA